MSKMKKFASLLLALALVFALGVGAYAEDIIAEDTTYSITITNANVGETYAAYKIFDAVYSGSSVTYYIGSKTTSYAYYTAVAANAALESGALFTLVETGTAGYYQVVVNSGVTDSQIITFFTSLGELGSASAQDTAESNSLTLYPGAAGYYFVTTTTGSVITINSAYPTVNITDKNDKPVPTKTETTDGTAGIGDTVEYQVTITAAGDVETLVYHDVMSSGLTFNSTSVVVKIGDTTLTAGTDYNVLTGTSMKDTACTFEIEFTVAGLAQVDEGETITITYSATVNENAVIGSTGNTNTGSVSYGDAGTSTSTSTTTKVYDFNLSKTTSDGAALSGAEFTLSEGSTAIAFVELTDASGNVTGYRVATAEEKATDGATTTTIKAGSVNISGLDAGTYTLTETKAPDGYNQLAGSVTVTIDKEGNVTINNGESGNTGNATNGTVTVVNQSGSALPSTGGIGTTIFYIIGSIMVLGAVVLLITRKRMSKAE